MVEGLHGYIIFVTTDAYQHLQAPHDSKSTLVTCLQATGLYDMQELAPAESCSKKMVTYASPVSTNQGPALRKAESQTQHQLFPFATFGRLCCR